MLIYRSLWNLSRNAAGIEKCAIASMCSAGAQNLREGEKPTTMPSPSLILRRNSHQMRLKRDRKRLLIKVSKKKATEKKHSESSANHPIEDTVPKMSNVLYY